MKKLLLILVLFSPYFSYAQNYQCLQSGVKHYFTNANGYLRGIRIDSVTSFTGYTVYYPYHTPRGYYSSNPNLDSNGGSWLGKQVMQQTDGTFLFDNLWHDTVVIKTQALPGDSWIFYNDTTTLYYKADLIAADTMTILGAVDSIKRILITAHNTIGIVTADPVDSFQIILSRNNGFVQVFDLYTFPYHAPDSVYRQGLDFYLDRIIPHAIIFPYVPSKANAVFSLIQLVNPTYMQLYQWNVGDIYEYGSCSDLFEHMGSVCAPVEQYFLDTITAANITTGNSSYNFKGELYTYNYLPPSPTPIIYSSSTNGGVLNYSSTLLIDTVLMPEEFHQKNIFYYMPGDTSYCITNTAYAVQQNIQIADAAYKPIFEVSEDPSIYKSPLGLLSSSGASAGVSGSDVHAQKLIYYNRGGVSCGSYTVPPTSVNDIVLKASSIIIFPNPASDELNITSTDKINRITINNLLGQTIFAQNYNAEKVQVNVVNLPVGIYIVKINGLEVRKFEKE